MFRPRQARGEKAKPRSRSIVADTRVVPCQRVLRGVAQQLALNELSCALYQSRRTSRPQSSEAGVLQPPPAPGRRTSPSPLMLSRSADGFLRQRRPRKQGASAGSSQGATAAMIAEGSSRRATSFTPSERAPKLETLRCDAIYLQGVQGVPLTSATVAATTFWRCAWPFTQRVLPHRAQRDAAVLPRPQEILTIARLGLGGLQDDAWRTRSPCDRRAPRGLSSKCTGRCAWGCTTASSANAAVNSRRRNAAVPEGVTLMAKPGPRLLQGGGRASGTCAHQAYPRGAWGEREDGVGRQVDRPARGSRQEASSAETSTSSCACRCSRRASTSRS